MASHKNSVFNHLFDQQKEIKKILKIYEKSRYSLLFTVKVATMTHFCTCGTATPVLITSLG